MKKKISLLLCIIFTVLTMAACGTDPTKVDYYGTSYDVLQQGAEGLTSALASMTTEELEYVKQNSQYETEMKLIEGWQNVTADLGEFKGLGELVVNKANGTVTVDQYVEFEARTVDVTYVYDYDYGQEQLIMTDVNVDLVYTLGEKMSKAGLNTLMGMGTVFTVLILISLIIYCFRFITVLQNLGKKKAVAEEKPVETKVAAPVEEAPLTDDLELVAVISAAIAASTGTSTDSFVVRSISRR